VQPTFTYVPNPGVKYGYTPNPGTQFRGVTALTLQSTLLF
jgi:hypothetical protein